MVAANPSLSTAQQVHTQLVEVCARHRACERELALLLWRVKQEGLHHELGYASLTDYAQSTLQLEVRKTRALLALGAALPDLPVLDEALQRGTLPWTKARDLLRVVDADNTAGWVELAQRSTSRELESHVRGRVRGEEAPAPGTPVLHDARTRMVFEASTDQARLVRDMLAVLRHEGGPELEELSDGEVLAALAQTVLAQTQGSEDAPTSEPHLVVVHVCRDCRAVTGDGCEADDATVAMASCDAVHVDLTDGPKRGTRTRSIPPRVRTAVLHRDQRKCRVPGCSSRLWLQMHHATPFEHGGSHTEDNLVCLCSLHHQLQHSGRLAVEIVGTELELRFADGRQVRVPLDPDAVHVDRAPR